MTAINQASRQDGLLGQCKRDERRGAGTAPLGRTATETPGFRRRAQLWRSKLNKSNRSPIAGMLRGTYEFAAWTGFGKLSRLRSLRVPLRFQLRSMNFT